MVWLKVAMVVGFVFFPLVGFCSDEEGFTQQDRDELIRIGAALKVFMQQVDKRFEELREDMNKRFEQIDKRFEQIDKRFEQVDKRFEQMMTFLWMLVGIFTALTTVVIGFAYWDRRTIIRKARDEAIEAIEKEGRLQDLIRALRRLATDNPKLEELLRTYRLL